MIIGKVLERIGRVNPCGLDELISKNGGDFIGEWFERKFGRIGDKKVNDSIREAGGWRRTLFINSPVILYLAGLSLIGIDGAIAKARFHTDSAKFNPVPIFMESKDFPGRLIVYPINDAQELAKKSAEEINNQYNFRRGEKVDLFFSAPNSARHASFYCNGKRFLNMDLDFLPLKPVEILPNGKPFLPLDNINEDDMIATSFYNGDRNLRDIIIANNRGEILPGIVDRPFISNVGIHQLPPEENETRSGIRHLFLSIDTNSLPKSSTQKNKQKYDFSVKYYDMLTGKERELKTFMLVDDSNPRGLREVSDFERKHFKVYTYMLERGKSRGPIQNYYSVVRPEDRYPQIAQVAPQNCIGNPVRIQVQAPPPVQEMDAIDNLLYNLKKAFKK